MRINVIPFIILFLMISVFTFYRYSYYKKKEDIRFQKAAPLLLFVSLLGVCITIFMVLFTLGIVS